MAPAEWLAQVTLPARSRLEGRPTGAPSTSRPPSWGLFVTQMRACCLLPMRSCFRTFHPVVIPSSHRLFTPLKICLENTFEKQGSFKKWQV